MGLTKNLVRVVVPRAVRNWVRRPGETARWAWADARARVGQTDRLELRPGWVIRSHPGAYRFAYHAQVDDPEQVAEFDQFVAHCTPGMVLFDLGAYFGLFALAAVHYGGPAAQAVAVDPSPLAAWVVRYQARVNGVADRLRVVQASAGAGVGRRALVAAGIGSAGYFVAPTADHPPGERIEVETVSIDGLVEATGLTPPRQDRRGGVRAGGVAGRGQDVRLARRWCSWNCITRSSGPPAATPESAWTGSPDGGSRSGTYPVS